MLKPVPETVLLALKVVNAPAAATVAPMLILLIVPAVAGLIVTNPVPVGDMTTLALAGLRATAPVAVKVVNRPAAAVVTPIEALLIVPAVAGLMVTTPVPVGDMTTLALAGLSVAAPVLVRVVNRPAAAVVTPIEVLLMVLAAAGLIVTTPVPVGEITTFKFAGLSATEPIADNV